MVLGNPVIGFALLGLLGQRWCRGIVQRDGVPSALKFACHASPFWEKTGNTANAQARAVRQMRVSKCLSSQSQFIGASCPHQFTIEDCERANLRKGTTEPPKV